MMIYLIILLIILLFLLHKQDGLVGKDLSIQESNDEIEMRILRDKDVRRWQPLREMDDVGLPGGLPTVNVAYAVLDRNATEAASQMKCRLAASDLLHLLTGNWIEMI